MALSIESKLRKVLNSNDEKVYIMPDNVLELETLKPHYIELDGWGSLENKEEISNNLLHVSSKVIFPKKDLFNTSETFSLNCSSVISLFLFIKSSFNIFPCIGFNKTFPMSNNII